MIRNKIKNLTNKKSSHLCMIIIIIAVILFVVGIIILQYNVEGEKNMPFTLSKISIISTQEGLDSEAVDTKWAFQVYQSNDIYLYISKNENYDKTEIIKSINIDNIKVETKEQKNVNIYKPDSQEEKVIFKNKEENKVQNLEYLGDLESNLKQLKISNQGGVIAFRVSNDNLTKYTTNDDEVNHSELLKKAGITEETLKEKISFDLKINLESGKEYKTTVTIDLPVEGVVENGTASKEITDLEDIVFKREQN